MLALILMALITVVALVTGELRVRGMQQFLKEVLAIERKPERADAIVASGEKKNGQDAKRVIRGAHIA